MLIRQETSEDFIEIYKLIAEAFETAEHAEGNEADLVIALRKGRGFIPELSLVAEINQELVGHILFTKAKVANDEVIVLAPLSVKPKYQRQGVGMALINHGHRIATELGYQYSIVLGSELYYPKAGYVLAEQLGIEIPPGIPSANFMAIKLQENAKPIHGAVTYPQEFGM